MWRNSVWSSGLAVMSLTTVALVRSLLGTCVLSWQASMQQADLIGNWASLRRLTNYVVLTILRRLGMMR